MWVMFGYAYASFIFFFTFIRREKLIHGHELIDCVMFFTHSKSFEIHVCSETVWVGF